ncbi:DUF4168 domain-containing protein [Bordetella sp. 2513F-2]
MQRSTQAFLAAAALAFGLAGTPALAQNAAPSQSTVPQRTEPSEAQLQKYVGASQKVAVVADEYRPKVQAAPDDNARESLLKEADEKMVQAVNADGMTVDEFNDISRAVQEDPELQQRLVAMMQQQQRPAQ